MALTLLAGDTPLGTLTYKDMDWPRTYYSFEPTPEYDAFREILDLRGSPTASAQNMAAAEKLDLRVITENGRCLRLLFIFISGDEAIIRQGLIRQEPDGKET